MPTPEAPAEALSALSSVLRRCGYRWYVFGAQAVILWGEPRMSADLDVTVEMPSDELMEFVSAMEEAGFRLRIEQRSAQLDLEYVRQTVGLLEQALGQSDLLPLLEAQIRETAE